MRTQKMFVLVVFPLAFAIGVAHTKLSAQQQPGALASQSGLDLAAMDKSAPLPCEDF